MRDPHAMLEELAKKRKEVLKLFDQWIEAYPDFRRISEVMQNYKINEFLIQYLKHSPPPFIQDKAIEVYKKALSFKTKLTNKKTEHLVYRYTPGPYCIDAKFVKSFISEYQAWNQKAYQNWNDIYYLNEDFFKNSGYKHDWEFYIKHNSLLKSKADEIQKGQADIISLLNSGQELVLNHDRIITSEYERSSFEMSLYEREIEIEQITEGDTASDEEYCYVYTLECELFIFYVGIASNPKERFDQHITGAFGDESHLFKSKFIQKYHTEVRQRIVFEGTRRECKEFEKKYIAEFSPLGNMTEGGEG